MKQHPKLPVIALSITLIAVSPTWMAFCISYVLPWVMFELGITSIWGFHIAFWTMVIPIVALTVLWCYAVCCMGARQLHQNETSGFAV